MLKLKTNLIKKIYGLVLTPCGAFCLTLIILPVLIIMMILIIGLSLFNAGVNCWRT